MTLLYEHMHLQKSLLASMIGMALAPTTGYALDLAQSPPGTIEPYVAPNVILSLDDSTSMNTKMTASDGSRLGTRTDVLVKSVKEVFSDRSLLADEKIRFAWQTMGNCAKNKGAISVASLGNNTANSMRILDAGHRQKFLDYMDKFYACTTTPTHDMVQRAHNYMQQSTSSPLNTNSPWASKPGVKGAPYLGCRRSYHILLTDGGWNGTERRTSPRNFDGSNLQLPNNVAYGNTDQTRAYRDAETQTTIADWAFSSWATNLAPDAEGELSPSTEYRKAPATETFHNRVTGTSVVLEKFWNPRYDPATWPHMVTFTIGFSDDALPKKNYNASGSSKGAITPPSSLLPYDFDGSFADYAAGNYAWRAAASDKGHDMWHAAINGRGRFFAVEKGEDLAQAFRLIVQQINTETEPDRGSVAASGSAITRSDVHLYSANYDPQKAWKGWVAAQSVNAENESVAAEGWGGKTTADWIDDMASIDSRLILTWGEGSQKGVPFRWASDERYLSNAQKAYLNVSGTNASDGKGQARLAYVRGDRSQEGDAADQFRQRQSRQGDIINSAIWYVGAPVSNYAFQGYTAFVRERKDRTPMLYVGGNDGMLHGFQATDGRERIAYVPHGVIPGLAQLTHQNYDENHRYFVDGSPMSGDVNLADDSAEPDWRTMLVGTLGGGGKGYFVLDVTRPESAFSEANAANLVVSDRTLHASGNAPDCSQVSDVRLRDACRENEDIGHVFAPPVLDDYNALRSTQIVKLNNDRWAVVLGNGYNSKNQRPVLLIQYLDGNRELVRLVATGNASTGATPGTTDNGLSAPRVVDINADGRPDVVYAGDIKGHLWKFVIASANPDEWGVAFNGQPMFTAMGPPENATGASRTERQPITAAPTVRANDRKMQTTDLQNHLKTVNVGGMMVAFGTGINVAKNDAKSVGVQTVYSVLDNTRYKAVGTHVEVCNVVSAECRIGTEQLPAPVTGVGELAEQFVTSQTQNQREYGAMDTAKSVTVDWERQRGWYMDLPKTSERLLKHMGFYDGSNLLSIFSQVPAKGSDQQTDVHAETCEYTQIDDERQYLTLINIMDGKSPSVPVIDFNQDGQYSAADNNVSRMQVAKGSQTMLAGRDKIVLKSPHAGSDGGGGGFCPAGSDDCDDRLMRLPEQALRPTWRQLN